MEMPKIDAKMRGILREMGFPVHLTGTRLLGYICSRFEPGESVTKVIYPAAGRAYGMKASTVERCVRYACEVAAERAPEQMERVFGWSLDPDRGAPSNREAICEIARIWRED